MIHWPSVCPFKALTSAAHYCWQNLESDDSCFLGWCCPERRAAEKQCFGRLVVYLTQSPTSSFCLLILWLLWPSWRETADWGDEEDTSCWKVWVSGFWFFFACFECGCCMWIEDGGIQRSGIVQLCNPVTLLEREKQQMHLEICKECGLISRKL